MLTWEHYLGERLLRFVLNKDTGRMEDLSYTQNEALYDLDSGGVIGPQDDPRPSVALASLDGQSNSRAWRLRQRCGGAVPDPIGDDDLTRCLTRIARDLYSILLSAPDLTINSGPGKSLSAASPFTGMAQSVTAHPLTAEAGTLLADEAGSWRGIVVHSALGQSSLDRVSNPEAVIEVAAERWQHLPGAGPRDFMQAVVDCLTALRRLAQGERIEVLAIIGLRGIRLEEAEEHRLSAGVLRRPTEEERRYSPFLEVGTPVEAVLETKVEMSPARSGEPADELSGGEQLRLTKIGRAISLASALVRRDEESAQSAAEVAWITEVTPVQGSGAYKPGVNSGSWAPSVDYGRVAVQELAGWVQRIEKADLNNVEIAIERLLRALFEPIPDESLIDSVIAWEGLLGTRSETAYRVTAGLAVLCEDDLTLRLERQKELQRIYNKRSRMVHGDAVDLDLQTRNRAIQVGLEALARLILDRPGLLGLTKSEERATHLLLGLDDS